MRLLLDTHALIWWLEDSERLSLRAEAAIGDPENTVFVSAATAWEMTTKVRRGKLPSVASVVGRLAEEIQAEGFELLPISFEHGRRAGSMPGEHRDPFDRMLIAQALAEEMVLVSNETVFDAFGVSRLW
ncbi:type II toxin-antitoxin system VapC family toxin [Prosthecomicrobium pneumaticum]|uniref:PIN domain nuclease of toxin-antitoxin system n=1 Tax=Prosthecomicrobium pneumaticum TaxID=81895 RepID=A0A7W9FP28_9HYPH|nr:type II toxin-antitoxin system VapC family toxin [Prosthecomicrobium pneumaticum]MBB5754214.1 PIN domain nuclease of toxin-antitoxin system [Prosthecomicrobium pneumaticum]